jgi:hypothetical protein
MRLKQEHKIIAICSVLGLLLLLSGNINLPLPNGIQEYSETVGRIESCDLDTTGGGKYGASNLFVGITFKEKDIPYLSWNTEKSKLDYVKMICRNNKKLNVKYKAQRLLLKPKVTFWIQSASIE